MSYSDQDHETIFVQGLIERTETGKIRWRHVAAHGMFVTTVGKFSVAVTQRHFTDKGSDFRAGAEELAKRKQEDGVLLEALVRSLKGLAQASGQVMYLANAEGEVISIESPEVTDLYKLLTGRFPCLSLFEEEIAHRAAKLALFADVLSELGWFPTQSDSGNTA